MNVRIRRQGGLLPCVLVACVVLAGQASGAVGQSADEPGQRLASEDARLKAQVESKFSVVPTRDGIILVPRVARTGVQSIEIAGGGIAIDGRLVTGSELRGRLGGDAELVAALSYVDSARLRLLFFPPADQVAEPAPASPPPAVETPSGREPEEPEAETRRYRQSTESRVAIGRSVRIEADERVRTAVVVIGGSADIDGYVGDAVVVVGGSARLGNTSEVRGDVVVIGGTVDRQPGARVMGEVNVVGIGLPRFDFGRFLPHVWLPRFGGWGPLSSLSLVGTLTRFVVFGLIVALLALIAGPSVGRIGRTVVGEPWKSGLVGLLAELVMVPLLVLIVVILVVSIVGIPLLLLVPFAVLVIVAGFFLGFAGVAVGIGRVLTRRFGGGPGVLAALLVGLASIWGLTLLGRLVMLASWPAWTVSALLLGVGFVIEYVAWTVGFGAALLSRFGSRDRHPVAVADYEPPAPPPPDLSLDGSGIS